MVTENLPNSGSLVGAPLESPFNGWEITDEDPVQYKDAMMRGLEFFFGAVKKVSGDNPNPMNRAVAVYQKPEEGDYVIVSVALDNPNDMRIFDITNEWYGDPEPAPEHLFKKVMEMADGSGMQRDINEYADYGKVDHIETASLFGDFLAKFGRKEDKPTESLITATGKKIAETGGDKKGNKFTTIIGKAPELYASRTTSVGAGAGKAESMAKGRVTRADNKTAKQNEIRSGFDKMADNITAKKQTTSSESSMSNTSKTITTETEGPTKYEKGKAAGNKFGAGAAGFTTGALKGAASTIWDTRNAKDADPSRVVSGALSGRKSAVNDISKGSKGGKPAPGKTSTTTESSDYKERKLKLAEDRERYKQTGVPADRFRKDAEGALKTSTGGDTMSTMSQKDTSGKKTIGEWNATVHGTPSPTKETKPKNQGGTTVKTQKQAPTKPSSIIAKSTGTKSQHQTTTRAGPSNLGPFGQKPKTSFGGETVKTSPGMKTPKAKNTTAGAAGKTSTKNFGGNTMKK